ncbi:MAG: DNA-processing protein DprA [Sediminibacterium sp.]
MANELLYKIALTLIPDLGPVRARILLDRFGDAPAVFRAKKKELGYTEGIGVIRANQIREWNDFKEAEAEMAFIEKNRIQPLFITDPGYPQRLLHCYDAPALLYYRGTADLNCARIISIIGTRNNTDYGRMITEQLIQSLQALDVLIVSGLAFGIDAIAHKACMQQQLLTVGVLAHGMDTIYPIQHKALAKEMLLQGGLLTEFRKNTRPDKHNFPKRNRIVAGMADATVVIETAVKGGSMITAELANSYNRDVFAFPGKITDARSGGCLKLIQQNKAILLTDGAQLMETMGWQEKKKIPEKQRVLFVELTEVEQKIMDVLSEKEWTHIDELPLKTNLSNSMLAAAILNLELQNMICAMPGKMYKPFQKTGF